MPVPELRTDFSSSAAVVTALRSAGCVFAEDEARLLLAQAADSAELADWVHRRVSGMPLEYILGWAEFAGQSVKVRQGVFVPRRRTELLVNQAAALLEAPPPGTPAGDPDAPGSAVVVDLCCGSGAVGAALARRVPWIELHSADIDGAAVQCARLNVEPLGGKVHQGDLFRALPEKLKGRVRMLVVNAPYVPTEAIRTMPPEARLHEPRGCLDGGSDGLDFHRRVAAEASEWLSPGGYLLIETSELQVSGTASIMAAGG